jgi:hypothetical protein
MPRSAGWYAPLGWRGVVFIAVVALFVSAFLAFARPVVVVVNGERVETDVPPVTTETDHVYVPLRSVADALGAELQTDAKIGKIYVTLGGETLSLQIGDRRAYVNGMPFTLRRAAFVVRGRVMVPLDAVARSLKVRARYDARDAKIEVDTPGIGMAPHE